MSETPSTENDAPRLTLPRCPECGRIVLDPRACPFRHPAQGRVIPPGSTSPTTTEPQGQQGANG